MAKTRRTHLLLCAAAIFAASCGGRAPAPSPSAAPATSPPATAPKPTEPAGPALNPVLLDPARATETAPARFRARFVTTKGPFVVQVTRAWAPKGADRFFNLVKAGYYDDVAFFRVINGFMVQFGIHGNPQVNAAWQDATIPDDPVTQSNTRGMVTYATGGPNTRTTQVFINFGNNAGLDRQGFAPFGRVVEGMDVVDSLYDGYGEGAPSGQGPRQGLIQSQGNAYLHEGFPKLDYVKKAEILG